MERSNSPHRKGSFMKEMSKNKTKGIKIAALVITGIPLAILLLFAIGETVGGDWSGLGHLIQDTQSFC
jgi:hypothetical protein